MKRYYCWKCDSLMPFLDEEEWKQIAPLLPVTVVDIKEYRVKDGCDLNTARRLCSPAATAKFEELTGMPGVQFDAIYHHRLSDWGPECPECSCLLRSPRAEQCAECGWCPN